MFFRVMLYMWQFMLDLVAVMRMTDDEKDAEIMLLRQQLRIVERKCKDPKVVPFKSGKSGSVFSSRSKSIRRSAT
jgi:hypothetical protein